LFRTYAAFITFQPGLDSTRHRFALRYTYDLNGRRVGLWHSDDLARNPFATTTYTYDGTTGLLSQVADWNGNVFAFAYDIDNRLMQTQYPGGGKEMVGYDMDGNVVRRTTLNAPVHSGSFFWSTDTLLDERLTRDIRGKVTLAASRGVLPADTVSSGYSALGHLVSNLSIGHYFAIVPGPNISVSGKRTTSEGFTLDALGNIQNTAVGYVDAYRGRVEFRPNVADVCLSVPTVRDGLRRHRRAIPTT